MYPRYEFLRRFTLYSENAMVDDINDSIARVQLIELLR